MAKNQGTTTNAWSRLGLSKDRDYFVENLSILVASGMPVVQALMAISREVRSSRMKKIIAMVAEEIEAGSPIWRALSKSGLFKEYTVSLVRLGEESGRLVENLKVVTLEEEKERNFKAKLRSAMMYPIFVLTLTVIIGVGIAWFILPKLATVFDQMDIALPWVTRVLIGTGIFLGEYGYIVVPIFVVVSILLFYIIFFFKPTRVIGQVILFSLPGISRLMKEVELARFGYLLGTLLQAGLPITLALDSLANATTFVRYQRFYRFLREEIENGTSFQQSFLAYKGVSGLIPSPIQQLIVAGEQGGHLAQTFVNVGAAYEQRADNTTKNLTVILEPILLVIVWLGVVAVALAVILPIYSLVGNFETQ